MYRESRNYDEIAKLVIEIYQDYGLNTFPIKALILCERMQILTVPYSLLNDELLKLSLKKSKDGYCFPLKYGPNTIFYNDNLDDVINAERIEFTILHEIKHIVCSESRDGNFENEMADYFAKYLKCPIPYLIVKGIDDPEEITKRFDVSWSVANNVSKNVVNRHSKYKDSIFSYEIPLLKTILGDDFEPKSPIIYK